MPSFTGYIRNTSTFSGKSKRPPYKEWTAYSAEIHPVDADTQKLSFGFDKPDVKEGDYVYLEADKDTKGYLVVDQSTIKRLDPPPPKAVVPVGTKSEIKSQETSSFGEFNRKTNPEDAKRMSMSAARSDAIASVAMLLEHNALPVSSAQGKAGTAKRFDEVMAAIDKLTVKFYNDVLSLRLLDTVADTVVDAKPKSELPTEEAQESNPIDE